MTAEEALDGIENKTSSTTNYTRAEMIFFANYFAEIHHYAKLKELEGITFNCINVVDGLEQCKIQCAWCEKVK